MSRTITMAHRGASGLAPENTAASFELALQYHPDFIEFDINRSKDGHLVVVHDATLKRTAGLNVRVADLTLAELKALDVGSFFSPEFKGERMLTLKEAIGLMRGRVGMSIEVKFGSVMYPGIEEQLIDLLRQEKALEGTVLSSFNWDSVVRLKQLEPAAVTEMICLGQSSEYVSLARRFGCEYFSMEKNYLSEAMIKAAAEEGLGINVWAPDTVEEQAYWLQTGVWAITTNHIERLA